MSEAKRPVNYPLWIIAIALCLFGAHAARELLVPIVFSILVSLVLAPAVRLLMSIRLPRSLAAGVVVIATIAAALGLLAALSDPAQDWINRTPQAFDHIDRQLQELRRPLRAATKATETLMNLGETQPARPRVVADGPSAVTDALKAAPSILISVFASVFLTFLLLLHGEHLLRKFVFLLPAWGAKRTFVVVTRAAQLELSRYLFTITVINAGLGLATAAALALLQVPDPLLWAGVVALLNYAPYLGPAISALLLLIAGFADHSSWLPALAPPGAFLALHLFEGQLITPLLVGRQLSLDPVVIFLALLTFGWIWGIVGLLMAVPLLACLKVLVQRLPGGEPWARLLVV